MSKHQVIYTSCKSGMELTGSGLQVYSHDASFRNINSIEIKKLRSYELPIRREITMTDDLVAAMPPSFMYCNLRSGECAIVLNTYLGLDINKIRFGNLLSHAIICDEDEIQNYPCEFFNSNLLRRQMDEMEVNSTDKPKFLPEPELKAGNIITFESVANFLDNDNRLDIYKKMLYMMILSYCHEEKKIVICDLPENIIYWIAALHYAVPLEFAKNLSFSTYEYAPAQSTVKIYGVVHCDDVFKTNYDKDDDSFISFDFIDNHFPHVEIKEEFFDFIETCFSISSTSLRSFHKFIINETNYEFLDNKYYDLYLLFCLYSNGLSNDTSLDEINRLFILAQKFARNSMRIKIVQNIVNHENYIFNNGAQAIIIVLKFIADTYKILDDALKQNCKTIIAQVLNHLMTKSNVTQDGFNTLISEVKNIYKDLFDIVTIFVEEKIDELHLLTSGNFPYWKREFIVKSAIDVIFKPQDKNAEIIKVDKNYVQRVCEIITAFHDDFIESKSLHKFLNDNRNNISLIMLALNKTEFIYTMYINLLRDVKNISNAKVLFSEQINIKNDSYHKNQLPNFFSAYYIYLKSFDEQAYTEKLELLQALDQLNVDFKFRNKLIDDIFNTYPLSEPIKKDASIILELYKDNLSIKNNRFYLILLGLFLGKRKSFIESDDEIENIKRLSGRELGLTLIPDSEVKMYLEWVVPCIYDFYDMQKMNDIFKLTGTCFSQFLIIAARKVLKEDFNIKLGQSRVFRYFKYVLSFADDKNKNKIGIFFKDSKIDYKLLNTIITKNISSNDVLKDKWQKFSATINPKKSLIDFFKKDK